MKEQIEKIREKASREILAAKTVKELQDIKVRYLGRKGLLTIILRGLASLPPDVRPRVGSVANRAREEISKLIEESLKEAKKREQEEKAAASLALEASAAFLIIIFLPFDFASAGLLAFIIF